MNTDEFDKARNVILKTFYRFHSYLSKLNWVLLEPLSVWILKEKVPGMKWKILRFAWVVFLVFFCGPLVSGARDRPPLVHVTGNLLPPTYHHEYSTAQIEAMSGIQAPSRAAHEPGLTLFEYEVSSQYEMSEKGQSAAGPLLIWAKSVGVNFSVTRMEVFVSSQYARGSCQYEAVLAHENTHVAINERVYKKYRALLIQALGRDRALPTRAHPLRVSSEQEGEDILDRHIKGILTPLEDRFRAEDKRENAKIDTPASYARTQARCRDW
jgi:hypothetical protein